MVLLCPLSSHTRVSSLPSHRGSHSIPHTPSKGHYFSNDDLPLLSFLKPTLYLLQYSCTVSHTFCHPLPLGSYYYLHLLSSRIALAPCLLELGKHHPFLREFLVFPAPSNGSLISCSLSLDHPFINTASPLCTLSCNTREHFIPYISIKWFPQCIFCFQTQNSTVFPDTNLNPTWITPSPLSLSLMAL